MQQGTRYVRHLWVALVALTVVGCAEPTPVVTTVAAPDLSGVAFEVHQEPG